jgi:hypothetical protein
VIVNDRLEAAQAELVALVHEALADAT